MDYFGLLNLLGGLALFLYGMNVMGDGLSKTAGGKLELMLERLSSTPIRGMILGTVVTAVIQSSSATTVMVVGFVNSGILKLSQATGIILGANLGTTITSWILSLVGIEGSNSWVSLFKPSTFTPLLAMAGIVLYLFIKDQTKKNIGLIFLGFTVLMYGMSIMSDAVEPLADIPEFTNVLLMFSNPFLGFLVGTVITAIIQSSSASVGILQTLSLTGAVTYGTAIPIIMGQNLGTCITALFSAIGANKNGRRAAFIHFYYNVITEFGFMIGFYTINSFVNFSFLENTISPVGVAGVHTIFNLCSFIIFMPLTKQLEWLARKTVKDKAEDLEDSDLREEVAERIRLLAVLDDRFLETPAVAVSQCAAVSNEMANIMRKTYMDAANLLFEYDEKILNKVVAREEAMDIFEDRLGTYMVKLSTRDTSVSDSNRISIILHCLSDLERISDHALSFAYNCKKLQEKGLRFTDDCYEELRVYTDAVREIVTMTAEVFINYDIVRARRVEPLEEVIDNINERAKRHHVRRLKEGTCSVDTGIIFDNLSNNLERISDHCSNIAVCVIQISENVYETHEYLDTLKHTQSPEFQALYKEYNEKYHL